MDRPRELQETSGTTGTLGQNILIRFKALMDERRDYETGMWADIGKYINPRRDGMTLEDASLAKGRRRGKGVYDGTPLGALNTWRDGMQGFLVSESLNWFISEMVPHWLNTDRVVQWLQEYDRAMYSAFSKSNFYSVLSQWFGDAGSIGTATLYTEEDLKRGVAVHTVIHPREVFIAENKFGFVDTVFRQFEMTSRQLLQKFGETCSERAKSNCKGNIKGKHKIIHAVFPNDDLWPGHLVKGKPFRSVYIDKEEIGKADGSDVLRDSGYDLNPYAVWRFRKNSDEVYGYSPAADALVEVLGLNTISKSMRKAAQLSVEPPMNVPEEMRGRVAMTPNGQNYYDNSKGIFPVYTGINFPVGIDREERLQKAIEDKFRVEFFTLLSRKAGEKTAYEVAEIQSEKATLMGSQIDQLYNEGLINIFDIVSDIAEKNGDLPDIPPEIEDIIGDVRHARIKMVLNGPLAQAQRRLYRVQPIQNGIATLTALTDRLPDNLRAQVFDKIDLDETVEEILEGSTFPQKLIRSDELVAEIREERARQVAEAQQREMLGEMADKAGKLNKTIEPDSVLDNLRQAV